MTRKDIKFFVKPEERIIVGVYEYDENELWQEVYDKFPGWMLDIIEATVSSEKFPVYPNVIRATAVCSFDDEWNEETGKKVVEAKINLKRHYRVYRMVSHIIIMLSKIEDRFSDLCENHLEKMQSIENDIADYFNSGKAGENS